MAALPPSPLSDGTERTVDAARAAIGAALRPVTDAETVPLQAAAGRVLHADVPSPIDVPAHDNAAMDGFALHGADLAACASPAGTVTLARAAGTVFAGRPHDGAVPRGHCIAIMTGAVMPAGLDTVLPRELATVDAGAVTFAADAVRPGDHRRRRGEDLAAGQPALHAGRVLRPADVGLLASLGLAQATVRRRLRVALFSTGDEVVEPGQPLPPGGIYDSNRHTLGAALRRLGVDLLDLGRVPDDATALEATLRDAVAAADAVVTSGGVSMGDADHTRAVLDRLGAVQFWKVAMRPGRPFAFGTLRDGAHEALLFALPGNPVAALVSFYVLARDALLALAGARVPPPAALTLPSAVPIRKRPGRTEFQRGTLDRGPDGGWQVRPTADQGAGILRSLSEADALIVLAHERGPVAAGEPVAVWLFDGLV